MYHAFLYISWPSLHDYDVKIGSFSRDDADGNENVNVHHAFLSISLPSLYDYDVKMPNFTFCLGREHKTTTDFVFLFLNFDTIV